MDISKFHIKHYSDKNSKKKMIFVHGLLGASNNWGPVAQEFQDFHILAYDQRGHGRSAWSPDHDYSLQVLSKDLKQIIQTHAFSDVILVGHSLGARVVQNYASQFQCKGLVLVDMGPEPEPQSSNQTTLMLKSIPTPFSSHKEMTEFFNNSLLEPSLKAFLRMNIKANDQGQYDWRVDIQGAYDILEEGLNSRWDEFKKIVSSCLVIRGENSKHLAQATYQKMIAEHFCSGEVIPGAGHWVHHEKKDEFTKALRGFVDGLFLESKL